MEAFKSLIQPLVGGAGGSSVVDGMKLVVLGGTVETARRVSSSAWSHFVNSFFLTAHFSEEDYPYDWLMLWLSRRPEWQRSREFETTTRTTTPGSHFSADNSFGDDDYDGTPDDMATLGDEEDAPGKVKTRVVFQPTFDTTHTIYYRGHWLRVRRGRKTDGSGCEVLSISVVARNNTILKQLVLQAKKEYEAEAVHRIQIYFADSHGSWRWTDSRHKRPMGSIVLNPGVKEMLLNDTKDFLASEKWYADRGIPFRRGYLLHGVPGSGKSSLIHAIAGQLMLDIYVVSLSASWISDSTLTTLMGRVPARCILLLEDLDAAFTRSTSRDDGDDNSGGSGDQQQPQPQPSSSSSSRRRRGGGSGGSGEQLSDVNTLSLSGLLNALDGVAAAEGRILFATTNHLERLDPALSRPGRMDVWVEFKNASKWQAEALFRNFFPSEEDDDILTAPETPISTAHSHSNSVSGSGSGSSSIPSPPSSTSLWSMSPSFASSTASLPGSPPAVLHQRLSAAEPLDSTTGRTKPTVETANLVGDLPQFGSSNQTYLPPPVEPHILANHHSAKPLDRETLGMLAKRFADAVPEEEFSVAALQGYLLKNKSQPEAAASGVGEWVVSEREMRERLKKEKEAREVKEKLEVCFPSLRCAMSDPPPSCSERKRKRRRRRKRRRKRSLRRRRKKRRKKRKKRRRKKSGRRRRRKT
ncbi:hypothetical protein BD779DRAFT_1173609 [Infundibulicybe gibba]|nr:hypothetical protein BD779DRAFT_1173609 [Infundibulicybe gibba]